MEKSYFLDPKDYTYKELIEEDHKYVLGVGFKKSDMVIVSGKGCKIKDIEGKEYIDFMSSTANVSAGFSNEKIIEAMKKQLDLLTHCHMINTNIPKIKVAKLVVELFPEKARMSKFFTSGGGSEANEAMFKLARRYTANKNATKFISWWESYHGPTAGALSATGQKLAKASFWEPLSPEFIHVPMPNCHNCDFGKTYPECEIQCAKYVKNLVEVEGPDNFAGMLFEPISSAAGGLAAPKEYFEVISEICEKENIVLMFDEVVTGFGRTGKIFGCEHYEIYPKMMSFGKSFVSGYATASGVVVNKDIVEMGGFKDLYHGSTCTGNIFSNAVAYANINFILDNDLTENAKKMGEYLFDKLSILIKKYPDIVGEIRGKGLLGSIVFNKKVPVEKISSVTDKASKMGLILGSNNRLREHFIWLCPPLIINKDEIDFSIDVILKSFEHTFK